ARDVKDSIRMVEQGSKETRPCRTISAEMLGRALQVLIRDARLPTGQGMGIGRFRNDELNPVGKPESSKERRGESLRMYSRADVMSEPGQRQLRRACSPAQRRGFL